MDIYEICGYPIGINREGVNFLEPSNSFSNIVNGFVYRQELKSRMGFSQFGNRLGTGALKSDFTRVMGIFEFIKPTDEKELLAITKKFLYKFNTSNNTWYQIPNTGMAPANGFSITTNDQYVSGTAYPTKSNGARFIFTGIGMSDVYFYDPALGVNGEVQSFTQDDPDYSPPTAGALTKASYVFWFGERLNFFSPVVGGIQQSQAVLYSGIRNAAGNGDKFDVAGSGQLSADTYEYINGATIAGDYMLINFNRSNWTIEKTRDAFNPYFFRKIPSVLGTDAAFSAVTWNNETKSIGKTGIISSDGKASLRVDNKIPYFTADEISQVNFNQTYGGFDRINDQFLFTYMSAANEDTTTTQDRVLVHNYKESTWSINTQRFSVFGQTDIGINLTWNDIYEANNPSWKRMKTTTELWGSIGLGGEVQKTLAGDDQSFIYQLNQDYDDYFVNITGITQADPCVVTVEPCALQAGDFITISDVAGMTEINDLDPVEILSIATTDGATTSITINLDSIPFTAYDSGGTVNKTIPFSATLVPFNPYRAEGRKVYVSHVEFLINTFSSSLKVSVYSDEDESPFITNVPVYTIGTENAREWVTMTVNQEANFITLEMNQESVSAQLIISSIRIHCARGGFTSQ